MNDLATTAPPLAVPPLVGQPPGVTPAEVLQAALIDSRQRWRELIHLAADFAFETDEWGRFTLIIPDPALDWPAGALIGQPSATLLADSGGVFDPFRVTAKIRHRHAWLKRGDGGIACLNFCAAPIVDPGGHIIGSRGVGFDMTELDDQTARLAGALRRAEVLDHILSRMGQEVVASRMMDAVLEVIANAAGAEGMAVMIAPTDVDTARMVDGIGTGADAVVWIASQKLWPAEPEPPGTASPGINPAGAGTNGTNGTNAPVTRFPGPGTSITSTIDGRPVVTAVCQTRYGEQARLIAWRFPGARAWDRDDSRLVDSAAHLVRMALEREAVQLDMARQARTDSLTGLLNRRAFLEEMERYASRQDRDNLPATLIFADLDNFKPVNDRLGHEAGDDVLRRVAVLLRKTFRPTDLVARLGGDEFAIWMNGADHMTAAERAEFLRDAVPRELAEITDPDLPRVSVSIGIACREPGGGEPLGNLMRRADLAMYEVKRGGRGHWRVSLLKRP